MHTWRKVGCCLAAAMALASQAEDIHLTGGNGLPDAVATQVSAGGGKIYLGDGTYKLTATLVLSAPVEIVGEGTSRETVIIDAQTKCRAVNMSGAGSVLANLTVRNGTSTSTESGGNIYMTDGVVSNCVISGGKSLQSSGSGNVRMAGGTLVDCSLVGGEGNGSNSANGSSVCASGGRIVRCRITDAAYDKMSSTAIALSGTAVMENCLVSNNKAGTYNNNGSVVAVSGADARVVNCTVVGNVSGACRGIRVSAGQVYNTVMYGNGGTAAYEWGGQNGGAFHNCASTVAITGGADCKTLDTAAINVFEPGGDYVPLATSPLVNTGSGDLYDSAAVSGTDLAGNDRRNGASIDIGCYEVDTTSLSVTLSADIYAAHVGEPVAFTCTVIGGAGGAVTRDFDFGDGKSVAGEAAETVSHAFDEPGFYTVSAVGHCGADSAGQTLAHRVRVVTDRLYVAQTGSDEGEATQGRDTSVTPFRTIGYALHSLTNALSQGAPAIGGVTIFVADGDYPETGLVLGKGIVVRGNAADRSAVTVGAANSRTDDRVFTLGHAGDAVIDMTVRNGTAREGGNINMTDGVISNCVISGGKNNDPLNGGSGGNVRMAGGTLVDCSLVGGEGNGGNSANGSSVCASGGRVVRCRITDAAYDKMSSTAIFLSGTAVMENCLVSNNKAGNGSVVAVSGADARVVNCTVVGNVSGACRGICVSAGQVYNTVMYGNGGTAAYEWGGQNAESFIHCAFAAAANYSGAASTVLNVTDEAFQDYANWTADLRGLTPRKNGPLENAGGRIREYEETCRAISSVDLLGRRRCTGFGKLDIGCLETSAAGLAVILR